MSGLGAIAPNPDTVEEQELKSKSICLLNCGFY